MGITQTFSSIFSAIINCGGFLSPMNSPNLKKLVTSFLILSAVASSGALFILNNFKSQPADASFLSFESDPNPQPDISKDAVAESLSTNSISAPSNATEDLSGSLAKGVAEALLKSNPNGPQQVDGSFQISTPNEATLNKIIEQSVNESLVDLKNDFNKNIPTSDLNLSSDNSLESKQAYVDTVVKTLNDISTNSHFDSLVTQEPSLQMISDIKSVFDQTVQELKQITVPSSFATFHQKLLVLYVNQRDLLDFGLNADIDPVRSLVAVQNSSVIFDRDEKNVRKAFDAVGYKTSYQNSKENKIFAYIQTVGNLFVIPKAQAASFVDAAACALSAVGISVGSFGGGGSTVPVTDSPTEGQTLNNCLQNAWEWLKQKLLEQAIEAFVNKMQQGVFSMVQNSGNPRFIGDWQTMLNNSFETAAGEALYQIAPQLCSGFGPLINKAFLPTLNLPNIGSNGYGRGLSCSPLIGSTNMKGFYSNFSGGGWNSGWQTYSEILKPNNNLFGSLIDVHDEMLAQADKAEGAAQAEGQANNGFNGTKVCVQFAPGPPEANGKLPCAKWQVNTPGETIANSVDQALGASIQRVTSQNTSDLDLTSLLIKNIAKTAIGALSAKAQQGLRSISL